MNTTHKRVGRPGPSCQGWMKRLFRSITLALALAGTGSMGTTALQAAEESTGLGLVRRSKPPTNELNWVRDQLLLHNEDLQKLLSHLNEEKEFGPTVPKGHRWVDDKRSLARMLPTTTETGVGWNAQVICLTNGVSQGSRETTLYAFRVAKTRVSGKPYTAVILVGRDVSAGRFWVRSLFREFVDADPLALHEYAVVDSQVIRLSMRRVEPLVRSAMLLSIGQTQQRFKTRTYPALQRAPHVLEACRTFLEKDPDSTTYLTTTAAQFTETEPRESWWKRIVTPSLKRQQATIAAEVSRLWDKAMAWLRFNWPELYPGLQVLPEPPPGWYY